MLQGGSGSKAVRSTIIKWITNDVVGPRNGLEEELPKSENPTQSYLSGILFSRMSDTDPEEDEQEWTELDGGESDDDPQEERVSTMASLRQSSFGLTCTVPNDTNKIRVHIEYGTYDLVPKITKGNKPSNGIRGGGRMSRKAERCRWLREAEVQWSTDVSRTPRCT